MLQKEAKQMEEVDGGASTDSTAKEQPLLPPPIAIPGDRLRQTVPWMLRDYRYKRDALNAELQKLYAQDDFDPSEIDALEAANEARFSRRWFAEALTEEQVAMIAKGCQRRWKIRPRAGARVYHLMSSGLGPGMRSAPRQQRCSDSWRLPGRVGP